MIKKILDSFKALRLLIGEKRDEIENKKTEILKQENGKYRIYGNSEVNAEIGEHSYVAINSVVTNCKIGKFCSIGPNVVIGYGDHPTGFISTSPAFYLKEKIAGISFSCKDVFESSKQVIIENDVWIGANVYIKNGIRIKNGAIIAAGAVVIGDVPDYAIVGGIPAKIIKYRFEEKIIQELLKIEWWNWNENKIKQAQHFFVSHDIENFINSVNVNEG